jgi:hypothetical protein
MTTQYAPKLNKLMVAPVLKSLKALQSNQPTAFYELVMMCRQPAPTTGFDLQNSRIKNALVDEYRLLLFTGNVSCVLPSDIVKKVVLAFVTGRGMNLTIGDLPTEKPAQASPTPDIIRNAE